jgi:hypothetical protein
MGDHQVGVGNTLLVRVWFEPARERAAFRARVTHGSGVPGRTESFVTAHPDQVVEAVQQWLEGCLTAQGERRT